MTLVVSPLLGAVFTKFGDFIKGIVPAGTIIIKGPVNRAAQPSTDHVVFTPIFRKQLRTNVETDVDPYPAPDPGAIALEQGTRLDFQVDFYGALAGDWVAAFSAAFRDDYGVNKLAPTCAPLYADEGRMMPLVTGEEQFLDRWTVTAVLQYNPVTTVAAEFASSASAALINVDVSYPP
jgi:hypothetical protein